MALAKTIDTQREFSTFFENSMVKKTYLALVSGSPGTDNGTIEKPLAQCQKDPRLIAIDPHRGKKAVTNWRILADFGSVSLLEVTPITGRTHQIRVHLASIGLPLAIDPLYGASRPLLLSEFKDRYHFSKNSSEKPLIDRLTLHCYQLRLPAECAERYPASFTAGLDKKFAATLKMLTKHGPVGSAAFHDETNLQNILTGKDLY
jgi:23S rRNA-/tRNA-specific pseudouridylate synthase